METTKKNGIPVKRDTGGAPAARTSGLGALAGLAFALTLAGCSSTPVQPAPSRLDRIEAQCVETQRGVRAVEARMRLVELEIPRLDGATGELGSRIGGLRRRLVMAADEFQHLADLWRERDGSEVKLPPGESPWPPAANSAR